MEPNQNRHDLAFAEAARAPAVLQSVTQQLVFPLWFNGLTKVIDAAKELF